MCLYIHCTLLSYSHHLVVIFTHTHVVLYHIVQVQPGQTRGGRFHSIIRKLNTFFEWSPPSAILPDKYCDTYILTIYLAFYLTFYLTYILAFYLAFFPDILSGTISGARGWGPAVPTETWRSRLRRWRKRRRWSRRRWRTRWAACSFA